MNKCPECGYASEEDVSCPMCGVPMIEVEDENGLNNSNHGESE